MQSASPHVLRALISIHPTTFHITSYWGAVVFPRFCSSQYVMCGCFFLIIFVSIVGDCLGSKIKVHPPYVSSVCKAFMKIYFNSYVFILPSNLNVFFYKFTRPQPEFFTLPVARRIVLNICLKQYFDTRCLVFYNTSPPRMFLSLDLLWEYWIQHGANGPLYVTSCYSTWIFCRGISGFATDCPCDVWCRGLTTCLLHVGPPFGNRILNNSWAVGLT